MFSPWAVSSLSWWCSSKQNTCNFDEAQFIYFFPPGSLCVWYCCLLQDHEDSVLCPMEFWWRKTEIMCVRPGHVRAESNDHHHQYYHSENSGSVFCPFLVCLVAPPRACLLDFLLGWTGFLAVTSDSSWYPASGNHMTLSLKQVSWPLLNPGAGLSRRGHQLTRREAPGKISRNQTIPAVHWAPAVDTLLILPVVTGTTVDVSITILLSHTSPLSPGRTVTFPVFLTLVIDELWLDYEASGRSFMPAILQDNNEPWSSIEPLLQSSSRNSIKILTRTHWENTCWAWRTLGKLEIKLPDLEDKQTSNMPWKQLWGNNASIKWPFSLLDWLTTLRGNLTLINVSKSLSSQLRICPGDRSAFSSGWLGLQTAESPRCSLGCGL